MTERPSRKEGSTCFPRVCRADFSSSPRPLAYCTPYTDVNPCFYSSTFRLTEYCRTNKTEREIPSAREERVFSHDTKYISHSSPDCVQYKMSKRKHTALPGGPGQQVAGLVILGPDLTLHKLGPGQGRRDGRTMLEFIRIGESTTCLVYPGGCYARSTSWQ